MGDEVLYAFRAIGPMDFDVAAKQTTPWEWFDPSTNSGQAPIPWWTKLSWHDHPPLVFWIQHIFIKLLGENNFAFRLPSALLGVLSVWLVYLIGRRIFSEKAGLISSLLLAVTANHIFISRVGLQESYVIFFILLTFLFFLKSLSNTRCLIWTGVFVGLGGLVKYTAFIPIPIILVYLLLFKRNYFKERSFWLGILGALIIFSPVIIYNIGLYNKIGHFDFQFSYIFNQNPKEWPVAPGKEEIGSLADRIKNFVPGLVNSNSYILLLLFIVGLFWSKPRNKFLFIWLLCQVLLFLLIGPTRRFLTMLAPLLALVAGNFISQLRYKYILVPIIIFEIIYSVNSQITNYPFGREVWAYSSIRGENYNWGYNELEKFFDKELKGKMPAAVFDSKYAFISSFQSKSVEQAKASGLEPYSALIIYDNAIYNIPQLWILDRRQIYHGWPVVKAEDYLALPSKNFFKARYFIRPTINVPFKKLNEYSAAPDLIEQDLIAQEISPIVLKNKRSEGIFKVYKF